MSQHPMDAPQTRRTRFPFAVPLALAAAAGVGLAVRFAPAAAGVFAGPEPLPVPASAPAGAADAPRLAEVALARTALAAIDADRDLKGVNVVVSIVNRVAVVGGAVSGPRQAKRVEDVLRSVPGIADVRNNCFVSAGPDPLHGPLADKLVSQLPQRPTLFDLPGVLTGTVAPTVPNTLMAAADPANPVVVRKPSMEANVLGEPVRPAAGPSAPPAPAPGTLTANRGDLGALIDGVRRTEARFAGLRVEVRDGVLVIVGAAPHAADAWDFAEKLQKVPGVTRVAVGAVAGK
ncbi:BON domain-containing protein [Gemmata sp.]|uniref:BON domain-containing protein n=1 Tax=Gemmata sp. TaxID=1914242 RepID=UPI003F70F989